MQRALSIPVAIGVALCASACSSQERRASAAANEVASVNGRVTSEAEGPMEGVLVSAKAVESTMTVTVASDRHGDYVFPEGRLKPGDYRITTRAAGYDLIDPGIVAIRPTATTIDLRLETTHDLASQLTAAEWFMSIEGGGLPLRLDLLDKDRCTMCHSFSLVTRSGHDTAGWVSVLNRMRLHAPGSSPIHPHDLPNSPRYRAKWGPGDEGVPDMSGDSDLSLDPEPDPAVLEQAAWLASINLSSSSHDFNWTYQLRTFPRPTGAETRVIITQYDLPRLDAQPHDAAVDPDGMIWYSDFGQPFIGRLDPRTAEVKEWRVPAVKPFPPFAPGGLDLRIGPDGNPWFALLRQGAILKFDKETEQMTLWSSPPQTLQPFVGMIAISPRTNMLWFADHAGRQVHGLDLKRNWITKSHQLPGFYGIGVLPNENLVLFSPVDSIHELDTRSGRIDAYPTPTPLSFPRRGHVDPQGAAWFAEYWAGNIARFDSTSKEIDEWPIPVPHADPYDVIPDRTGVVWSGGMATDYVFRLDPATGTVTKHLLPTANTNIRRIDVDNSTTPVTVWIGENHHAKITKLELLEGN